MTIQFLGSSTVKISRMLTGFYSLDMALRNSNGDLGWPLPSFTEVFGPPGVGKTNFAVSISGILASHLQKSISFVDLEIQDFETIEHILDNNGYSGDVNIIRERKDEDMLEKMLDDEENDDFGAGILDSIAAISPVGEQQGKIGDANMGKRAISMSQFSRKAIRIMQNRRTPFSMICTNHVHPTIGFVGSDTSGGETKKFMATLRINLKKVSPTGKIKREWCEFDNGRLLEGLIVKSRYGFSNKPFRVFMVAGEGLHMGLSAMYDCVAYGLAEIDRKTIKIDGQTLGKLQMMIDERHNDEMFVPFINALKAKQLNDESVDDEKTEETAE